MNYIIYIILGAIGFFLFSGIRIVRPTERAVIERLGKYKSFGKQGFNWVIPVIDRMVRVNITERMADVDPLDMITKDNLNARVDLVVYYKVKPSEEEVKRSLYNVNDVESQIISLAQTTARNIIGDMAFKDVNSKRNTLNTQLAKILDDESDAWGIQVVRVELKEITPPKDVQETMNRVIKAENEKDAAKDFATAKETEADGIKRAEVKKAEGEKQASILKAEGQAKAFELIEKSFKSRSELLRRLEVTENSLKDNTKIVLTEKGISPSIIMDAIPMKSSE
jgi:regulator of protease activity HflC (stomatin/prohibitin superfamily)